MIWYYTYIYIYTWYDIIYIIQYICMHYIISYTMLDWLLPLPLSVVWCFSPGPALHETRSQWNLGSLARKSWISNHCEVGWWKTCHFSARESSSMIHFRLDWSLQWDSLACLRIFGSPKYCNIMQHINGNYINDSKLAIHQWWTFMHCHGNTMEHAYHMETPQPSNGKTCTL